MPSPLEPGEAELQQRLAELIKEQPHAPQASPPRLRRLIQRSSSPITLGLAIGLALLVGLQLGALPWRYRREIWQIQGAVVGIAIGVVIGRYTARRVD